MMKAAKIPAAPILPSKPVARLLVFVLGACLGHLLGENAEQSASELLRHALHLADLYNWSDALQDFSEAEKLFVAAGDQHNALYAKLGRIRSSAEQRALPALSLELADELDTNHFLQSDKPLRMFCLIVKGDIDGEFDSVAMRHDWEQVQALARELGDSKWQNRAFAQLGLTSTQTPAAGCIRFMNRHPELVEFRPLRRRGNKMRGRKCSWGQRRQGHEISLTLTPATLFPSR